MALSLDDLRAQRDALAEALNSGAAEVRHGDKSVRYQTAAEMRAALGRLDREIAALAGTGRKVRRRLAYTAGKGL